ncbi:hypothetical protein BT93_L0283 [Corymbia citriodora subsp. variegata]|uniref:Phorbol-ester/DAG-type domain-containing protein n=1 Tax=Corymbia citriodora subsp. variegata TaxID=360336 RepID=A0A8T0CQ67_CORYI|nr:hypothetical protein BT93_L0283 [Corymbia citriodora subsp. variegata]
MSRASGGRIHPEHELVQMMQQDPFFCSACRLIGFGSAYGCKLCLVLVHKECMHPPPTAWHPLYENLRLKYKPKTSETSNACTVCGACSMPLYGGAYGSDTDAFHPPWLRLEKSINVNGVELSLVASGASACNWCKKKSILPNNVQIRSWWYVSACKMHNFHVGCVRSMMMDSWKNSDITFADEDNDGDETSMRAEMPRKQKGKRRGTFWRTILKVSFKTVTSTLIGDPTGSFASVLCYLGSKLRRRLSDRSSASARAQLLISSE